MFRVYYNVIEELEALELERIDEIFGEAVFHGLRKVSFGLYGSGTHAEGKEEIKRRMAGLDDRGLLVFG